MLTGNRVGAQVFPVSSIPDSLNENANCVIREYTREIELKSANSGTERVRKVITILNKEGENRAFLSVIYDKNSSVSISQITLYDRNGSRIKKVKPAEVEDSPAFGSAELYSDNRVKYYVPRYAEYPYTVEYIYETTFTNHISYGYWHPVSDYHIAVAHASLILNYPEGLKINRKEVGVARKSSDLLKNRITETWEINNISALEDEPLGVSLIERTAGVYLMPAELIYEQYHGSAETWEKYGQWINDLWAGKDILTSKEKIRIGALLTGKPDTLDRIKALYQYLQENTRYVSITLGLGGYQPFDAITVAETGYGDCKALTNYMHALLKFAGIQSFPALVSSGRYIVPVFAGFPNFHQFDHVILCVPFPKDTIWLECTSQKMPFGYLGDFTDDRETLLITENGGRFARTPKYDAGGNLRSCAARFTIDSTGNASGEISTIYRGLQYDKVIELIWSNSADQKKWLYANSSLPAVKINSFSIMNHNDMLPEARVSELVVSKNYGSFSGKYLVLPLNLLNAQKPVQKMLKPRLSEIVINRSVVEVDSLFYNIPEKYTWESLPEGKNIHSSFGDLTTVISARGSEVAYIRKLSINQGRYRPDDYKELYDFIMAVSKADNVKMILVK